MHQLVICSHFLPSFLVIMTLGLGTGQGVMSYE